MEQRSCKLPTKCQCRQWNYSRPIYPLSLSRLEYLRVEFDQISLRDEAPKIFRYNFRQICTRGSSQRNISRLFLFIDHSIKWVKTTLEGKIALLQPKFSAGVIERVGVRMRACEFMVALRIANAEDRDGNIEILSEFEILSDMFSE